MSSVVKVPTKKTISSVVVSLIDGKKVTAAQFGGSSDSSVDVPPSSLTNLCSGHFDTSCTKSATCFSCSNSEKFSTYCVHTMLPISSGGLIFVSRQPLNLIRTRSRISNSYYKYAGNLSCLAVHTINTTIQHPVICRYTPKYRCKPQFHIKEDGLFPSISCLALAQRIANTHQKRPGNCLS